MLEENHIYTKNIDHNIKLYDGWCTQEKLEINQSERKEAFEALKKDINSYIYKSNLLADSLTDAMIDYHIDGDMELAVIDIVFESEMALSVHLPELCPDHHDIKNFQKEYLTKVVDFVRTGWRDYKTMAQHIIWLKELMLKYSRSDVHNVFQTDSELEEEEIQKYVERHIKQVIKFWEDRIGRNRNSVLYQHPDEHSDEPDVQIIECSVDQMIDIIQKLKDQGMSTHNIHFKVN